MTGDVVLERTAETAEFRIYGRNLGLTVSIDGTDLIQFGSGFGGLLLTEEGIAATLTGNVSLLSGIPGLTLTATNFNVSFNTFDRDVNETFEIEGETIELQTPAGPYLYLAASPVTVEMYGFSLRGNIAFQQEPRTRVMCSLWSSPKWK